MAVMAGVFNETQRRTLEALCDTFVPSVESDERRRGRERDFLARSASDMAIAGADREACSPTALLPEEIAGVRRPPGRASPSTTSPRCRLEVRTADRSTQFRLEDPRRKLGVHDAARPRRSSSSTRCPTSRASNPNWEAIGYPGPISRAAVARGGAQDDRASRRSPATRRRSSADVCVVGSGAGGGVIAAELQQAGKSRAGARDGRLPQRVRTSSSSSCPACSSSTSAAGCAASEDGSISILAGSTLGGGTVVNYMNCIRTPEHIRREWAAHGLDGHRRARLRARTSTRCWSGISANAEATSQNRTHKKLIAGARRARLRAPAASPATSTRCDDPRVCGYCFAGLPEGLQAVDDEDLPAGRLRRRRPLRGRRPRRADPRRGRPRDGRRGHGHARGRLHDRADGRGADRRRGLRLGRVAGAAAALRHRRPGRRQAPAPASRLRRQRASTTSRSRAGSGRSSRRSPTSSRELRGRAAAS